VLFVLCCVQLLLMFDSALVTVLPALGHDLGVGQDQLPWALAAYSVAYGGLLITAGRIGDLTGHRRTLLTGLTVFVLASLACGLADGPPMFFAARALQGVGAALSGPSAFALVTGRNQEGDRRNRALGIWSAVGSGGMLAGSALGGLVADVAGWRWVFLANAPLGVVLLAALWTWAPRPEAATAPAVLGPVDVAGAVALTGGAVALVAAATLAVPVLPAALLGIVLLAAFVRVERRAAAPMVRLSLLANPYVRVANLFTLFGVPTGAALSWFGTLYLRNVLGASALEAGLGMVPMAIVIVLLSSRTGPLVRRFGVRGMFLACCLANGLALLCMSFLAPDGSYGVNVLPGVILMGMSAGLSFAPSLIAASTGVPPEEQGVAGGMQATSSQLGAAVGLALLNTAAAVPVTRGPVALTAAYSQGLRWALVLPVVMALIALTLPRRRQPLGR